MRPASIDGAICRCSRPGRECKRPDDSGYVPTCITYELAGVAAMEVLSPPVTVRNAEWKTVDVRRNCATGPCPRPGDTYRDALRPKVTPSHGRPAIDFDLRALPLWISVGST